MASNGSTLADEDGDFEDWIELYNAGTEAVDLGGWGLSDNAGSPFKWTFPDGWVLGTGEYLLVWASGKDRPGLVDTTAPAPLAPSAVEGLVLHLQADALNLADGATVSTWTDLSGLGNHATQPNAVQRPVYVADGLNGRPVLRFNRGAAQQFFLPTDAFSGMEDFSDFTFLALARWTGGTSSGLFGGFRGSNPDNAGSSILEIVSGGGFRLRLPLGIDITAPAAISQQQWHIMGAAREAATARARLTRDGELLREATGSLGQTLFAQYERVPVASSHDDSRTFGGEIAKVLLFNRSLSVEEQAGVEQYLNLHYGLTASPENLRPHTNFRISAAGEDLLLTRPDGSTADFVPAVRVPRDISYGRRGDNPSVWAYFYEPTPEAPNTTTPFAALIEPVTLSHAAGAHSGPFDLQLAHPDPEVTVVYTLDGSEPDIHNLSGTTYSYMNSYRNGPLLENSFTSSVYTGPISVVDRSHQPNKLSLISTTADSSPAYFPTSPIKKGTVVRARAFRDGAGGPITTATYFVSATNAFAYPIPIVSLSVNEDGLFDFLDGIYVAGVDHVTNSGGRICNWGNYNRRGSETERAAHVEFFADGTRFLEQAGGIRIQGNCSRMRPFKSIRLYARTTGEDEGIFDYPLFAESFAGAPNSDTTRHQRLILRTPNFYDTAFSRLYQGVYEGAVGRIQPVKQFINGEFWGLSLLRDRFDNRHLENLYGLDPDNVTIIDISYRHETNPSLPIRMSDRIYTLSNGIPQDMADFEEMRAFIIQNNMANAAHYAAAGERICLSSFIDHLILKIFAGDDHYAPEVVFWRAREPENEGFGDGRWRFHVKDFDSTLHTGNFLLGLATGTHPRPFGYELFASLLDNPDFRTRFINRFADLLNSHFLTARFQQIIHDTFDEISPLMAETVARWNGAPLSNPDRPFNTSNRNNLLSWAQNQPSIQRSHIRSFFFIGPERALTVRVNDEQKGRVQVNTLLIDDSTPGVTSAADPWTGLYFPGYPVTLTAHPADGQRLIEWRVSVGGGTPAVSTGSTVSVNVSQATSVEAVFAEIPPPPPDFLEMVGGVALTIDLREWFPALENTETALFSSSDDTMLSGTVAEEALTLDAFRAGEATFTVVAGDSSHTARVLIYGEPFVLGENEYTFDFWSPDEPAGSYPANMLFTQSDVTDPGLETPSIFAYRIPPADAADAEDALFPYRASSRTRINGLGSEGIRFINTGRGRDLGAAVLSLDTRQATQTRISWTAGTDLPNSRIYALRLQYRIGLGSQWEDLTDENGESLLYVRNTTAGHSEHFGPVSLPSAAHGQPLVQLRWLYHHISGSSGPRAALRLDDIVVASGPARRFGDWLFLEFTDPARRNNPAFSAPDADPTGSGMPNLIRYALGLGWAEEPTVALLTLEFSADQRTVKFFRHPDRSDVFYQLESSVDLQTWGEPLFDSRIEPFPAAQDGWVTLPVEGPSPSFYRIRLELD
ncbi:MAG: CotH kinase family protein [Opitutales bacterium]|nr:CotH kinase family protein [Opitutales bacterium]